PAASKRRGPAADPRRCRADPCGATLRRGVGHGSIRPALHGADVAEAPFQMTLRVAVVARSGFPLHGVGGLERHVYDLLRYLADAGVETTLIPRTVSGASRSEPSAIHARVTVRTVPYRTFPLAGRRGTTVIDRSTAYPLFGERAGRLAWELVREGSVDVV